MTWIKLIFSALLSWVLKRKVSKTIEVREYDKYEKWERKLHELQDAKKKIIKKANVASSYVTQAAKDHNNDALVRWALKRDKLHDKRDELQRDINTHLGRKPSRE